MRAYVVSVKPRITQAFFLGALGPDGVGRLLDFGLERRLFRQAEDVIDAVRLTP